VSGRARGREARGCARCELGRRDRGWCYANGWRHQHLRGAASCARGWSGRRRHGRALEVEAGLRVLLNRQGVRHPARRDHHLRELQSRCPTRTPSICTLTPFTVGVPGLGSGVVWLGVL
jgi:hypothetical protein